MDGQQEALGNLMSLALDNQDRIQAMVFRRRLGWFTLGFGDDDGIDLPTGFESDPGDLLVGQNQRRLSSSYRSHPPYSNTLLTISSRRSETPHRPPELWPVLGLPNSFSLSTFLTSHPSTYSSTSSRRHRHAIIYILEQVHVPARPVEPRRS